MPEPIKISTSKYRKEGKVDIDGNLWTVKLPGAATELKLSQAFRGVKLWAARMAKLDDRLESGKATDQELNDYEEYSKKYEANEQVIFGFFLNMFSDDTDDNTQVKQWVEETPMAIIQAAFEDIKNQANSGDKATDDAGTTPTDS